MLPYSIDRDSFSTEEKEHTTMVTQNNIRSKFIGLRTVLVILKNGVHSLKINALLDDASTKSYMNANNATELGLQGKSRKENPQKLTQLNSRSHPRHLVGKRTAQKTPT